MALDIFLHIKRKYNRSPYLREIFIKSCVVRNFTNLFQLVWGTSCFRCLQLATQDTRAQAHLGPSERPACPSSFSYTISIGTGNLWDISGMVHLCIKLPVYFSGPTYCKLSLDNLLTFIWHDMHWRNWNKNTMFIENWMPGPNSNERKV